MKTISPCRLQTLDGAFHFLTKSDLEGLQYAPQTLMPSDYSSTLSSAELNDVISYLMKVANVSLGDAKDHGHDFEDE